MFVERLSKEELGEYLSEVTLRNERYDSLEICSVNNWYNKLGECECRQVEFAIEQNGDLRIGETDILDFSFLKEHCVFMLKHFGEDYLTYLRFRVIEEDISDSTKAHFIKQNVYRLAHIKAQNEALERVRREKNQTLLSDFDSNFENKR